MQQTLLEIVHIFNPDIIHADHTAMMPLAVAVARQCDVPIGFRLHNMEWRIWQRYADELQWWHPKYWYISRQAHLLKNREEELLSHAAVAFPITIVDLHHAQSMQPDTRYCVAGAGVNPDEWKSDGVARVPHSMVLATVWSWIHNLNGGLWFIKEVMPKILREVNDATLTLLGKNAPQSLQQYGFYNVECKGYVESVKPYYHSASVYVAPLFVGGGVRIKILEAMAAGLPVVATSVSAEGILATQSDGLFVSDNADEQATMIVRLLNEPDKAREYGAAAQRYVQKHHTWKQEVDKMIAEYQRIVSQRLQKLADEYGKV